MTDLSSWRPLSQRDQPQTEETLFEEVPPHLKQPLLDWILAEVSDEDARTIALRLRLDLAESSADSLAAWAESSPTVHLDVLDLALLLLSSQTSSTAPGDELEEILHAGGSAWRVASSRRGLERRVDQTVKAAADAAAIPASSAADHLAAAWQAVYGRNPNPSRAYSECIKAVESAAIPVASPANTRATLGTVIRDLENQQQQWQLAITVPIHTAPIASLIGMLRLLWQGQTDRHGSPGPTIAPSFEAAVAAVHLAATLVQWFQSGIVRRSP